MRDTSRILTNERPRSHSSYERNVLFKKASDLGFVVDIVPQGSPVLGTPSNSERHYIGRCDFLSRTISISGSITDDTFIETLAHEVGHAMQWNEMPHSVFFNDDPLEVFRIEMDAVERARSLGIDMDTNYRYNYAGYIEELDLPSMGRS